MALAALLALLAGAGAVAAGGPGEQEAWQAERPAPGIGGPAHSSAVAVPELGPARALLEQGALDEVERLVEGLRTSHPYAAAPHLLLGDVHHRRNDAVAAVRSYRAAVLRDPDLLDRRAPGYQGRKIARAVDEALAQVRAAPDDELPPVDRKSATKMLRAMQRRIAGSCD